jgi:glycerol-3-phosphate acyltransferase PlsX
MSTTVAVDANGADLGPSEVAEGAAEAAAQGVRVLLFGPAEAMGKAPDGVEIVDAPVSIAKAADPVAAVRSTPDASTRTRSSPADRPGRRSPRASSTSAAPAASTARRSPSPSPSRTTR